MKRGFLHFIAIHQPLRESADHREADPRGNTYKTCAARAGGGVADLPGLLRAAVVGVKAVVARAMA
jgi:hypothetical protein